jgi:hypothetical protein
LRAVHAWQFGYIGVTGMEGALPAVGGELHEFRDAAAAALESTLSETIPDVGEVDVGQQCAHHAECPVVIVRSKADSG